MLNKHQALIYAMVSISAADNEMTNAELVTIQQIVALLPVFQDYDPANLAADADACVALLNDVDGFEDVLDQIILGPPETLYETAYALAVEVAAADLVAKEEELNLLQMLRHALHLDRLIATGIERGARARYTSG